MAGTMAWSFALSFAIHFAAGLIICCSSTLFRMHDNDKKSYKQLFSKLKHVLYTSICKVLAVIDHFYLAIAKM